MIRLNSTNYIIILKGFINNIIILILYKKVHFFIFINFYKGFLKF